MAALRETLATDVVGVFDCYVFISHIVPRYRVCVFIHANAIRQDAHLMLQIFLRN